jgi:DNA-binding XRE family transcriptional regulator
MIYFIKHTDFVKIGYTNNIYRRLSELQVSCPEKLKLLGLVEGTFEDEKKYHKQFNEFYSHGEWFYYSKELNDCISMLNKDLMWKYGYEKNEFNVLGLIKSCRLEQNLSLAELGERLGITAQSVKEMETREIHGQISIGNLIKALSKLGYKYECRAIKQQDNGK